MFYIQGLGYLNRVGSKIDPMNNYCEPLPKRGQISAIYGSGL